MFYVAVITLFLLAVPLLVLGTNPLVQLPNGKIQGRTGVTLKNQTYYAFEKIPYATPPVGELRFKPPVPAKSWEGVLNTTHLDVSCYQLNDNNDYQSEDCLFVNVFTPTLPSSEADPALPVMFFIHGGAFANGSSMYIAADLIIEKNIIFVTINYRLGPFGFLSTQDEAIPGNYGLKDQQLAIQWTHNNIHLFGGNPEKIIIFGQSAGSMSCAFHLLNTQSEGLFRGAILQSGSSLSPSSFQRDARKFAFATASMINNTFTTSNDSAALLEFLMNVDASTLKFAAKEFSDNYFGTKYEHLSQGGYFVPVLETNNPDSFITEKMYGLLQTGQFVKVPLMIGMTSEESLGLYPKDADFLKINLEFYDNHLDKLVPSDMQIKDQSNLTEMGRLIREIYTNGEMLSDHFGAGIRYYTDVDFSKPIIKHAEFHSKHAPTYFYQFSYDGELGHNDIHYDGADYVGHSEDVFYLICWDIYCDFSEYPKSDQVTVERMVTLWTNFAKYLNPTPVPTSLLENITWPQVFVDDGDFLYLDINENLTVKNHPKQETYSKWVALYDSLEYNDFDTY